MPVELFLALVRQVREPDQLASPADYAEVRARGRKNHIFERLGPAAEKIVQIALGNGHPEGKVQISPSEISVNQDNLVTEDGEVDTQVGCQDGLSSALFPSSNGPSSFPQLEIIE